MASVNQVTTLAREVLGRGNPLEDVSVKFLEEMSEPNPETGLKLLVGLRAFAVLHPAHNPHKALAAVMGPVVKFPDVPTPRGAVEVAALDELAGCLSREKAAKELERARALVAAAGPAPELPETPADLFDATPGESPEPEPAPES